MKDETVVVCINAAQDVVVYGVNSHNEALMIEDDAMALKFPNTQLAQQFISDLNNTTVGFFGTRPPRKPK